jgi:predicted ATP-grasp superfamily ATP-dependent carboligase
MPTSGRLRVLLSEGSSTSAREATTALGLAGHHVEICDPNPFCISRFSRFLRRFHRCPGLGTDPEGYLAFVLDLLARERFDVLLPIHEQGYLFAKIRDRLPPHVGVALPSFESYARAHSKSGFSQVLSELGLPQPATTLIGGVSDLRALDRFPFVVKTAIGTASRGTWLIQDAAGRERAVAEIEGEAGADQLLLQPFIEGPVEHAQAVFDKGRLVAMHAYRQLVRGAGGGPAMKQGAHRPLVRSHMARIGAHLGWHGALSLDYIVGTGDEVPCYIDCNPRLVEPINAMLSGLNLTELLLQISLGEHPPEAAADRDGVRSHMALQALLGCAIRSGSRLKLARESWRLALARGIYAGSQEELTPLGWDWCSVIPTIFGALWLLANPNAAHSMHKKAWGSHLLSTGSIQAIHERISPAAEASDTSPA